MDPLHFCIAVGPLAAYLLLLGLLNLSSRPFLTTGVRDAGALGVAVSGFVVAGPMELFLPEAAASYFRGFVWVLLLVFYALCLSLLVLLLRPRLVVYNVTADQLRMVLASVVGQLDPSARWAGDGLILPQLGVQLHLESTPALRNAQLVASGPNQNLAGWRRLETSLAAALRSAGGSRSPYGFFLVSVSIAMMSAAAFWMVADREGVASALAEMLRQS